MEEDGFAECKGLKQHLVHRVAVGLLGFRPSHIAICTHTSSPPTPALPPFLCCCSFYIQVHTAPPLPHPPTQTHTPTHTPPATHRARR
jgi:hypothetical protein